MKVAVSYDNGEIFLHFGRTERFKLYDVRDGRIASEEIVETGGKGHGELVDFLKEFGADALICAGIGAGARAALEEAGIALYPGVTGSADAAAKAFAEGGLSYDPEAQCDHHGQHEHTCYSGGHACE